MARLPRRPIQLAAGEDVQVQMEYALARLGAVVHHETECIAHAELLRHFAGRKQQVPEQSLVLAACARQPVDLFLWDEQDMRRRLRIDVAEGQAQVVLIDDVGRDLAPDDLAEKGCHRSSPSLFRKSAGWECRS